MYSINGEFGEVRLASLPAQQPGLFSLSNIGWHRCNDRYRIVRPLGGVHHLLLFTVKGSGFLRLAGRPLTLTPGTVALVPRNIPCEYGTPANGLWEFYWLHPAGRAAEQLLDRLAEEHPLPASFDPAVPIGTPFESLLSLCREQPERFPWLLSSQLSDLLHQAALWLTEGEPPSSLPRRAARYMEQHFTEPLTLDRVAGTLFVSPAHLIRVFKQEHGCTPHRYLTEYRLTIAAQLLELTAKSVDTIAAETGFSSAGHLIGPFKRRFGCTPHRYRADFSET